MDDKRIRELASKLECDLYIEDASPAPTRANMIAEAMRALLSEAIAEYKEDAERYRWLRVHSTQPAESWSTHENPESLDEAIDATRKSESEHG